MIECKKMTFEVSEVECTGYLYMPSDSRIHLPLVIMAHGFSGTQQGSLARTANDFANQGFAVFTFDYRGFGESSGVPRQVINIGQQHADWEAAIDFAGTLNGVDGARIGLWGSSLSGAHVVEVAAKHDRIAAVIAQVPFNGFPDKVEGRSWRESITLLWTALKDQICGWLGIDPIYIPVVGRKGELAVITTEKADAIVASMQGSHWQNKIAPRVLLDMALWYRPSKTAHRLTMPLLVCLAEHDELTPSPLARKIADAAPHSKLLIYSGTHFEFYEEPTRKQLVRDQVAFLNRAIQSRNTMPDQPLGQSEPHASPTSTTVGSRQVGGDQHAPLTSQDASGGRGDFLDPQGKAPRRCRGKLSIPLVVGKERDRPSVRPAKKRAQVDVLAAAISGMKQRRFQW